MTDWLNKTHVGDCRALMRQMIADGVKVQCIVTSPPYWGLRDYGMPGQFGLERSWIRYVARIRGIFRLARELLADDGVLWLNLGDSYAGAPGGFQGKNGDRASRTHTARLDLPKRGNGLKPKDLVGMPWRVAFALQADGWYLRSDIIWHKPNPMPESVTDRPTKSHEYLFMLTKSDQYHYDAESICEPVSDTPNARWWRQSFDVTKQTKQDALKSLGTNSGNDGARDQNATHRNRRSVWTVATVPFSGAHFATFPRKLIEPCIIACAMPGDTVFDPFMGSGTVAQVATDLGRQFIGCELNPEYVDLHEMRRTTTGMQF